MSQQLAKATEEFQQKVVKENEQRIVRDLWRKRDTELGRLKSKMEYKKNKKLAHLSHLSNFIKTSKSPSIYWIPAKQIQKTHDLLTKSRESSKQFSSEWTLQCDE